MIQACVVFILSDLCNIVAVQVEKDDPSICCFHIIRPVVYRSSSVRVG